MKVLILLAISLALAFGQAVHEENPLDRPQQDPIGNYNLMVQGRTTSGGQTVAEMAGVMSRITLPKDQTTLTASRLAVIPAEQEGSTTQSAEEAQAVSFTHTLSIETPSVMDFFMHVTDGQGTGVCFHSDSETGNLKIGKWKKGSSREATQQCSGELWMREITGQKDSDRRTELFCKSRGSIEWIELTHPAHDVTVHLDVMQEGTPPTVSQPGMAIFSLPAICVVNPQEASELTGLDRPEQVQDEEIIRKSSTMGRIFKGAAVGAMVGLASSWLLPSKRR